MTVSKSLKPTYNSADRARHKADTQKATVTYIDDTDNKTTLKSESLEGDSNADSKYNTKSSIEDYKNKGDSFKVEYTLKTNDLKAPIKAGTELGTITVKSGDEKVGEYPLVALNEINECGFLGKIWDWFMHLFL